MYDKILTGTYAAGYLVHPDVSALTIIPWSYIGGYGLRLTDATSIVNFGFIGNAGDDGVGVSLVGATSFENFGLVDASGYGGVGIAAPAHEHIVNGGAVEANGALGIGVHLAAHGYLTNTGTIAADGVDGIGVFVRREGSVVNAGVVAGHIGIVLDAGVMIDSGKVEGDTLAASAVVAQGALLVLREGADFIGEIESSNGTLKVANGVGTVTGLGTLGTLSGADSATFAGFGEYIFGVDATCTLAGTDSLSAGSILVDRGTLTLTNKGSFSDYGSITIDGGVMVDQAPFTGNGNFDVLEDGSLALLGGAEFTGTIAFGPGGGFVEMRGTAIPHVAFEGLVLGDGIDLTNLPFHGGEETVSYGGGQLSLLDGSIVVVDLPATGIGSGLALVAVGDGTGGTEIFAGPASGTVVDRLPGSETAALATALTALANDVSVSQGVMAPLLDVFTPAALRAPAGVAGPFALPLPGFVSIENGRPQYAGETLTLASDVEGIVLTGKAAAVIEGRTASGFGSIELLAGNEGDDTISGGGGSGTILSGTGANEILAGNGAGIFIESSGNDLIDCGSGADVVRAFGSATVQAGKGSTVFEDLGGTTARDKVFSGTGEATMSSGLGRDTFIAGAGTSTLIDTGHGRVAFEFVFGGAGHDTVVGFDPAAGDYIRVTARSWGTQMLADATVKNGNTYIDLRDKTTIEFVGVTNLTAADFHS